MTAVSTVRASLTPAEADTLRLVAVGLGNKQIARQLGYSEQTIKNRLSDVYHRLGLANRTEAALWAYFQGLVTPEPRRFSTWPMSQKTEKATR